MYTCLYFSCFVQCFFPYIDVCITFDAHELMVSPKKILSLKLAAGRPSKRCFPMGNLASSRSMCVGIWIDSAARFESLKVDPDTQWGLVHLP